MAKRTSEPADEYPLVGDDDGGVQRPLIALVVVVATGISMIVALTLIERYLGPPQEATVVAAPGTQRTPDQLPAQRR